jgi:hypothetical protein
MIVESLTIPVEAFERRTGWLVKPEGLCKGDICVPLLAGDARQTLNVRVLAERLNMPLIHDERHDLWCLGPAALGKSLATAELPDIELPALDGRPFQLRSLRGSKVLLVAWASW